MEIYYICSIRIIDKLIFFNTISLDNQLNLTNLEHKIHNRPCLDGNKAVTLLRFRMKIKNY